MWLVNTSTRIFPSLNKSEAEVCCGGYASDFIRFRPYAYVLQTKCEPNVKIHIMTSGYSPQTQHYTNPLGEQPKRPEVKPANTAPLSI